MVELEQKIQFLDKTSAKCIRADFVHRLFASRAISAGEATRNVLLADYKQFRFGAALVGIAQIETMAPGEILERADLLTCLAGLKRERSLDHMLLNIIDTKQRKSILICSDGATQQLLQQALQAEFIKSHAFFDRMVLRKTDLIPQLQKLLA